MSHAERLRPIVLGPGEGRSYALGAMSAVFKADEAETGAAYSISEWFSSRTARDPVRTATPITTTSSTSSRA